MAYTYSVLPQDSFDDNDFKNFPILDDVIGAIWLPTLHDAAGDFKRLKKTPSLSELSDSSSTTNNFIPRNSSFASLSSSGPQIRDRIKSYRKLYQEAEALDGPGGDGAEGNADEMKLVQQLISCAEAVACRDRAHASLLLSDLRAKALVFGSAFQRVASCFVQGLADRLAMVQPLGAAGYPTAPKMNIMDAASEKKEEALRLVYDICPYIQFGHFVANSAILEAFEGERLVHVVDLGMTLGLPHGHQWRNLIHSLAKRPGAPPARLRITAVGLSRDKFIAIGEELEACAAEAGVEFEFSVVHSNLESLKPEDVKVEIGEVVVVNTILQLHCVVKESRGALNSVLQIVHELAPKVMVVVEQDSSHNGPFFLGRFMEALHYYSAIFDSLDAVLPKYDTRRAKMEQFYFAEEIKNIVSCEGPARVERHERVDQWRRRMSRAGFQPVPLKIAAQAKQWLSSINAGEGYTTVEEKGCVVLGWKSKPIIAASCWKC
ncbi:GRAS family protein RAD1-like [Salvia hispanica]|uniref:GRAS family protein RAD1-like n=1 Tax=Salvia hispanica TaxID=49212 RepID=UPI00200973D6|nr:GRAS family protein RAD1-like [Salvia hispanica]